MTQEITKEVKELQELINNHDNIVFFGGAGVSTESGIQDFRSQDGLYNQKYDYPPETILSHSFFMRKPEEFFKFYRDKMLCDTAKPNAAHLKLAEMEKKGKLQAVITQNIDNLHQMAGSKNVLELHGSVYRNTVQNAGSHMILITSKIQKEFLTVNVAALSSLMLYCMEKI